MHHPDTPTVRQLQPLWAPCDDGEERPGTLAAAHAGRGALRRSLAVIGTAFALLALAGGTYAASAGAGGHDGGGHGCSALSGQMRPC